MKRKDALGAREIFIGVVIAATCAIGFSVALASISRPAHMDDRLATIESQAQRTKELLRPGREANAADVVCARDAALEGEAFRETASSLAAGAQVTIDNLDVQSEPAGGDSRVAPVRIRVSATGPYEGAIALLAGFGRQRPVLFVDSLNLVPKTSNVTLNLSGRVFCSA